MLLLSSYTKNMKKDAKLSEAAADLSFNGERNGYTWKKSTPEDYGTYAAELDVRRSDIINSFDNYCADGEYDKNVVSEWMALLEERNNVFLHICEKSNRDLLLDHLSVAFKHIKAATDILHNTRKVECLLKPSRSGLNFGDTIGDPNLFSLYYLRKQLHDVLESNGIDTDSLKVNMLVESENVDRGSAQFETPCAANVNRSGSADCRGHRSDNPVLQRFLANFQNSPSGEERDSEAGDFMSVASDFDTNISSVSRFSTERQNNFFGRIAGFYALPPLASSPVSLNSQGKEDQPQQTYGSESGSVD